MCYKEMGGEDGGSELGIFLAHFCASTQRCHVRPLIYLQNEVSSTLLATFLGLEVSDKRRNVEISSGFWVGTSISCVVSPSNMRD